jgi:hypothetical protein
MRSTTNPTSDPLLTGRLKDVMTREAERFFVEVSRAMS